MTREPNVQELAAAEVRAAHRDQCYWAIYASGLAEECRRGQENGGGYVASPELDAFVEAHMSGRSAMEVVDLYREHLAERAAS